MIKQKPEDVHIDEIMSFLEDTLRHVEGGNVKNMKQISIAFECKIYSEDT